MFFLCDLSCSLRQFLTSQPLGPPPLFDGPLQAYPTLPTTTYPNQTVPFHSTLISPISPTSQFQSSPQHDLFSPHSHQHQFQHQAPHHQHPPQPQIPASSQHLQRNEPHADHHLRPLQLSPSQCAPPTLPPQYPIQSSTSNAYLSTPPYPSYMPSRPSFLPVFYHAPYVPNPALPPSPISPTTFFPFRNSTFTPYSTTYNPFPTPSYDPFLVRPILIPTPPRHPLHRTLPDLAPPPASIPPRHRHSRTAPPPAPPPAPPRILPPPSRRPLNPNATTFHPSQGPRPPR
jgi:hypothetical protein